MRTRVSRYALLVVVSLLICSPPGPIRARNPQEPARLERLGALPVVYLHGDPYEMGLQQGALLRRELQTVVRDYLYGRLVLDRGAKHFLLLAQARLLDGRLPYRLRREMRGIADGAALSYQDVLLLNVVPDWQALTGRFPSWDLFAALFSGGGRHPRAQPSLCTAVAGWGSATVEGQLLVGYNLDCAERSLLQPYLLVAVRSPSQGNAFVSLGLVGTVGAWAGMNEEQLVATLSSSPSCDVAPYGQPPAFLLRQALESTGGLPNATRILVSAPRPYGGNVLLADGKAPQGIVLELSAHRHALFEGEAGGGVLVRTNHFLDAELAQTQREVISEQERASSEARLKRLSAMLEPNQGWIGVDKALALLLDARGAPSDARSSPTLCSVLFAPGEHALWIAEASGNTTEGSYVRLDLASDLLARP